MPAIDDLKDQRTELSAAIAEMRDVRQRMTDDLARVQLEHNNNLSQVNARIALLTARRDRLNQAITELKDTWEPV